MRKLDTTLPTRRRSRSRRAQIGGEGVGVTRVSPAYIKRQIPPYEMLTPDGLEKIEAKADCLLAEVGMDFRDDPEVLDIWRKAGASVSGERVKFEPGFLRDIIRRSAPSQFTQLARNPEKSVVFGGDNVVFAPAYGPPFVRGLDFDRRYATNEDFRTFVKLAYASESIHHSGGVVCEPVDVETPYRHLEMNYNHIRFSDKAFMGAVTSPERAQDSIEMAGIVFGRDVVERNCCLINLINVNSPLVLDGTMSGALKVYARAGQAVIVSPFLIAGAMGPVTVASNIAQAFAESMAGIALAQLINPGTPVMLALLSTAINMRTGAPSRGPEPMLTLLAFGQLARRLGVPWRGGGSHSTSKILDPQCMQEATSFMMATVMAGTNFVIHAAGSLEGGLAMSFEKFVTDAENLSGMQRLMAGVDLSDSEFGLDAYHEVGPGNHFLGCAHTMARYKSAFHEHRLNDADSFEQWTEKGATDLSQRANALWKKILSEYEEPPLDESVEEELRAFISRRKEELRAS